MRKKGSANTNAMGSSGGSSASRRSSFKPSGHVPNTRVAAGDYYGTGSRNPQGKVRMSYVQDNAPLKPNKIKKAPRGLA